MTPFRKISCGLELPPGAPGDALSSTSAAALATASRIARDDRASLHIVTALDLDEAAIALLGREQAAGRSTAADHARTRLDRLAAAPRAAGVETTIQVARSAPADALLADAASAGRDLIVVGTRERGAFARNLLGSTALTLLRRAPQTVWVARSPFGEKAPVVLCTIEPGDMAPRILATAAGVAARAGGTLHVLYVVDLAAADVLRAGAADEAYIREVRRKKRAAAEADVPALVAKTLGPAAQATIHLPDGDVAATILKTAADLRADVVVLGSVVHSLARALFSGLGRTAEAVLPQIQASLVVVKPAAEQGTKPAK